MTAVRSSTGGQGGGLLLEEAVGVLLSNILPK